MVLAQQVVTSSPLTQPTGIGVGVGCLTPVRSLITVTPRPRRVVSTRRSVVAQPLLIAAVPVATKSAIPGIIPAVTTVTATS